MATLPHEPPETRPVDPRAAELLRRRAEKDGPTTPPPPAVEPRKLDDADKAAVRAIAAAHPGWSARDIAEQFEAEHGWRPSYQMVGRVLADRGGVRDEGEGEAPETPPRKAPARKPAGHGHADPEVGAMSLIAAALDGLDPAATRRVLAWARARFEEGGAR